MSKGIAVVIGAGSIGRAVARRIGAGRLLLADYSDKALAEAAEQLGDEGYEVTTRVTDVSDRAAVEALADAAAGLGPVTQVVHNAGVSPTQASTERVLHIDLLGTALVLDAFARVIAPGGADRDRQHGRTPREPLRARHRARTGDHRDLAAACAAVPPARPGGFLGPRVRPLQAGQLAARATAAAAWGKRGARVNAVSPGVIITPARPPKEPG